VKIPVYKYKTGKCPESPVRPNMESEMPQKNPKRSRNGQQKFPKTEVMRKLEGIQSQVRVPGK
jgi:hypothetical protein